MRLRVCTACVLRHVRRSGERGLSFIGRKDGDERDDRSLTFPVHISVQLS